MKKERARHIGFGQALFMITTKKIIMLIFSRAPHQWHGMCCRWWSRGSGAFVKQQQKKRQKNSICSQIVINSINWRACERERKSNTQINTAQLAKVKSVQPLCCTFVCADSLKCKFKEVREWEVQINPSIYICRAQNIAEIQSNMLETAIAKRNKHFLIWTLGGSICSIGEMLSNCTLR